MSPDRLHTLTRILETLASSSIPLLRGIEIEAAESDSKDFKRILTAIGQRLAAGHSLEQAISQSDTSVPRYYTTLVGIGESSGKLKEVLSTLSTYIKKSIQVRRDLISSLAYPVMLCFVSLLAMLFISNLVLPNLMELYRGFGKYPPQLTLLVVGGLNLLQRHAILLLAAVAALAVGFVVAYRTSRGRGWLTLFWLRFPFLSPWISDFFLYRFLKILSIQVAGGHTVVKALETLANLYGDNQALRDFILHAVQSVSQGIPLSKALSGSKLRASRAIQLIRLGEEAGRLSSYLEEAAMFYEERINYRLTLFKELLQPALLVVIGLGVGFLLISLFLPIFQAVSLVGGKP